MHELKTDWYEYMILVVGVYHNYYIQFVKIKQPLKLEHI